MKRALLIILVLAAVGVGAYLISQRSGAGTPIASPSASATPLADDTLVLYEPLPGQQGIVSPLKVRGKARGTWFFEAVFPVILTDWDGKVIAQGQAHASTDWMTTDFVEFEATLEFTADTSVSNRGSLILKKDNPSDLPEHDDSREITVFFAK